MDVKTAKVDAPRHGGNRASPASVKCTNCFKLLGVASRMEIYAYLKLKGSALVGDIVKHMNLKQPTVSYHLNEMKQQGILSSNKSGKEVLYSINTTCKQSPGYERACVLSSLPLLDAQNA